ncbi:MULTISPECIES: hypothetical protein [unclassified Luteococcus]|uniref:hypothetical protein n=1 Tax=unclassified Luteococcus TaxID=2639923 RepID=UPI00313CE43B
MATTLKACAECGEVSETSRCPEHQVRDTRRAHRTDTTKHWWIQLSRRARRAQPFCTMCGSRERLTLDHSPRAWLRIGMNLPVRLVDVTVLCNDCNNEIGSSKAGSKRFVEWLKTDGDPHATTPDDLGGRASRTAAHPTGKALFQSQMGTVLTKERAWRG